MVGKRTVYILLECFLVLQLDFALLDKVVSGNDTLNCTERVKMV